MAFERFEPMGPIHLEMMAGVIAAVIANVNRNPENTPEPFVPSDFMPALRRALEGYDDTPRIIGADLSPEALSNLIDAQMFGHTVH